MNITFSPQAGAEKTTKVSVNGDIITIDDIDYDLSQIPEGGEAIAEDSPFIGIITRIDGIINLTMLTPLGPDAHPIQSSDWDDWRVIGASGNIEIPYRKREGESG